MVYQVKLNIFEGPLELLLYLVRKNEIEISDIPIATICQEYLEYLELMNTLNLDLAGEFLVLAATLAYIKSRMLLPTTEEEEIEEDLRYELAQHLLEYKKYKEAANVLIKQNILEKDEFIRSYISEDRSPSESEEITIEVNLFELIDALKGILKRVEEKRGLFEVSKEKISVTEKVAEILERLKRQKSISFDSLFDELTTREQVITTFLALLELLRQRMVRALQSTPFGPIQIVARIEGEYPQHFNA
jgi:segregation and condensation protein A